MALGDNCLPRIVEIGASCGCSLTRASIRGMTPAEFEALGNLEVDMHRVISNLREGKAVGAIESTLEMMLFSRMNGIKGELNKVSVAGQGSVILPYIYRRRKRNINSNYWLIDAGAATPGAGSGGIPASAWDLTLKKSVSQFATDIPAPERYFLPGKYLYVETVDSGTKTAYSLQYKIISAVNADAGGVYKTTVTVEPNYSAIGWAGLSAGDKLALQPTNGQVLMLANNVSDYESWCNTEPSNNPNELLVYWLQTIRETHCYNDEYLKALNARLTSGYFKNFIHIPLAEQKRQQHLEFVKSMINTAFYGQRINENQTPNGYTSLPTVYDPTQPDCPLEYKAAALGFKTQLSDCGRVADLQGNPLSLDDIASIGYDMKRAREASGGQITRIDWGTDRFTAGHILDIMVSFYKAKYGVNIERHYRPAEELDFGNQVKLKYNVYELPPDYGGYELAVFTDQYFDDKLAAAPVGDIQNRVRSIWGLDWSDIELGIGNTSSVSRKTNEADNIYNCVIKPNLNYYMLNSIQIAPMILDPSRHYLVHNFNNACPTLTVDACTVT